MKVLRGTLTFVLGMIVGIILFVVAIGGTVVALAMAVKVGDLQAKFTDQEIISSDSELYNQTMFDAVKGAITDFQNFDTLSLETLYEHYGISALNGVGGIDFTDKEFYHTPIKQIFGDFSIIVNSFTLRDVSKLTGNDFDSYNLPILKDNLDNNIKAAIDNILGSIKGDLTIRAIKTNLIPDFNIENDMLKALQDIEFSQFGSSINAFKLCTFIEADTDTFVPMGDVFVYVKSDRYEQVSDADLANVDYVAKDGTERFFFGAADTDDDGTADTMIEKELRFINKGTEAEPEYVVDNTCYKADFNASGNAKVFYRHYEYERYDVGKTYPAGTEFFIKGYANRVTTFNNDATPKTFDVYFKGYISLKDLYVLEGSTPVCLNDRVATATVKAYLAGYMKGEDFVPATPYTVKDDTIKKSSKLVEKDFVSDRATYYKVHEGTSSALMQSVAYLSIAELKDMDDFIKNVKIGDVVDVKEDSHIILKSLKDTTLNGLNDRIQTLRIDEVIEINDSSSLILKSLKNRGTVVNDLGTVVNDLYIDEVIEINNSSPRLMKSLKKRACKINDLGTIVDDMTLSEIIDIYDFAQVKMYETGDTDSHYLLANYNGEKEGAYVKYEDYPIAGDRYNFDQDLQEYVVAANGKYVYLERPITYVADSNGKYIKSPVKFELANAAEKGSTTLASYSYEAVKGNLDPNVVADVAIFGTYASQGNVFYKHGGDYEQKTALCTYLFNKGKSDASALDNLYFRTTGPDYNYTQYDGDGTTELYVKLLGSFVAYEKTNPAHADLDIYALHTSTVEDKYIYFVRLDDYRNVKVSWDGAKYEVSPSGTTLDTTHKFAKQYCETVYLLDFDGLDPTLDRFVYIDGEYVAYDEDEHDGMQKFVAIENVFIATAEQIENLDPATYEHVSVINEKSSAVLRMMKGTKINEMGSTVADSRIEDLMDISPDNMFDMGAIKTSKINDLGSAMSKLMNTMTIGKLLDWANVTDMNTNVKSTIESATLTSFFKSLTYNPETGDISIDMIKLYGLE